MDRTSQRLMMVRPATPVWQAEWTTPGTYSFVVPDNVYSISALVIGATGGSASSPSFGRGGAAAGGLRWAISIPVIPGETLEVVVGAGGASSTSTAVTGGVGGLSAIRRAGVDLLFATGGQGSPLPTSGLVALGGTGTEFSSNVGGGNGGNGGLANPAYPTGAGGGGAAGYAGNGGAGGDNYQGAAATAGTGGAAGGGGGAGSNTTSGNYGGGAQGGGVGIYGQGKSGEAGASGTPGTAALGGKGGSNGSDGEGASPNGGGGGVASNGGVVGGAPGGAEMNSVQRQGKSGAVRVISGDGRAYPSTRTANE